MHYVKGIAIGLLCGAGASVLLDGDPLAFLTVAGGCVGALAGYASADPHAGERD